MSKSENLVRDWVFNVLRSRSGSAAVQCTVIFGGSDEVSEAPAWYIILSGHFHDIRVFLVRALTRRPRAVSPTRVLGTPGQLLVSTCPCTAPLQLPPASLTCAEPRYFAAGFISTVTPSKINSPTTASAFYLFITRLKRPRPVSQVTFRSTLYATHVAATSSAPSRGTRSLPLRCS